MLRQHKPASTADDDDNRTTLYCHIVACTLAATCLVLFAMYEMWAIALVKLH